MSTFTDASGHEWRLAVTPYEYRKLTSIDIDIYDVVDREKAKELLAKLETDDMLLSDVLWLICEDDAQGLGIDKRSFLKSLPGEVLAAAYLALLEAITNFFRRPEQRMLMQKLIAFVRAAQSRLQTVAQEEINKVDVNSLAETFIESAMNSLGRSESTQSQQDATAAGGTP